MIIRHSWSRTSLDSILPIQRTLYENIYPGSSLVSSDRFNWLLDVSKERRVMIVHEPGSSSYSRRIEETFRYYR